MFWKYIIIPQSSAWKPKLHKTHTTHTCPHTLTYAHRKRNYKLSNKWQTLWHFWCFHGRAAAHRSVKQCVHCQFNLLYLKPKKKKVLSVYIYRFVWHGRPLTDVCWFEAMVNVPVKRAALCLIIRAHASVIGRWEAHEACVCSGKLLNCFCVYTKDYATKNIILSPRLRAQRIWSSADDRGEPFEKSAATNSRPNLSPR